MQFAHMEHTITFSIVRLINHYILVQNTFIMAQRQKRVNLSSFPELQATTHLYSASRCFV